MINYENNQRRSLAWVSNQWVEEVLAASGTEFDPSTLTTISGDNVQDVIKAIDNIFTGFDVSMASGVVEIAEVSLVSGATQGSIGHLDTVTMPSGENSVLKFSFAVPTIPLNPVKVRVGFSPATSGIGGYLKYNLDYDILANTTTLNPAVNYTRGIVGDPITVTSGMYNTMRLYTFDIAPSIFTSSGSSPYVFAGQLTRDVSVSGNYAGNVALVNLVADNVPGGVTGNTAGYVGGNLTVDGDLTVEQTLYVLGGTVPASGTAVGFSGAVVLDNNFMYVAIDDSHWRRTSISEF